MYKILIFLIPLLLTGCLDVVKEESSSQPDLSFTKQTLILSSDESRLYVNVGNLGLDIFDVSNPKQPRLLKNYPTLGHTYDISLMGNILLMAKGSEGVELLDVSDPNYLKQIAYIHTGDDNATAVSFSSDMRSIAIGTAEGVQLFDISEQEFPRYLGRYDSNGTVMDLRFGMNSERLYLANLQYGFELLNISMSARPELIGAVEMEGSTCDIEIENTLKNIYGASLTSAVKKVDIDDPEDPTLSFYYDAHDGSVIWDLQFGFGNGRLYLAKADKGLEIVQASQEVSPKHIAYFDTNGTARGVTVNQNETLAFVADGKEGLKIIDISEKSDPRRIGYIPF